MRRWMILGVTFCFLMGSLGSGVALAQDEAEGDGPATEAGEDFDLTAALDLFSKAESVEAYEKAINDPEDGINNLDLNEDKEIDYVKVVEIVEGETHMFIFRVPLSDKESQDVATIDLEKSGEDYTVQIVGDEEIYGKDYIVEPETSASALRMKIGRPVQLAAADDSWLMYSGGWEPPESGTSIDDPQDFALVVVVGGWPIVRFVYAPLYRPWVSPYAWGHYPAWWVVRPPVARAAYRTHVRRHHHAHYHRAHHRHSTVARNHHHAHHHSSSLATSKSHTRTGTTSASSRSQSSGAATQSRTGSKQGASPQKTTTTQPSSTGQKQGASPSKTTTTQQPKTTEQKSSSQPQRSTTQKQSSQPSRQQPQHGGAGGRPAGGGRRR